tara:strand:- start:11247 stop:12140 length:894 start_codon:yes stop_codon:yes gene_type:complete
VQKINIGIIGLGGIGGLIASLLKKKDYKIFSNKRVKKKYINLNLQSNFFGNFDSKIETDVHLKKVDIIFICTKYPFLKKNIKSITNKKALIIPFLNGLSHFKTLKKKFGKKCFISNIGKVVSKKKTEFKITHLSNNKPEVLISSFGKKNTDLKKIKKVLNTINFRTKIIKKDSNVIWNKLIRLSAISSITSLYDCNLGQIRKSKIKMHQLNMLVKEGLKISKKVHKFNERYSNIQKVIKTFPNSLTTSLQRDINSNYKSELETQIGAIVKLSNEYNVLIPMYKKIYLKLKKKCQKKS